MGRRETSTERSGSGRWRPQVCRQRCGPPDLKQRKTHDETNTFPALQPQKMHRPKMYWYETPKNTFPAMLVDRHGHSRQRNVKAPDVQWSPVAFSLNRTTMFRTLRCRWSTVFGLLVNTTTRLRTSVGFSSTEPQASGRILPSIQQNKQRSKRILPRRQQKKQSSGHQRKI